MMFTIGGITAVCLVVPLQIVGCGHSDAGSSDDASSTLVQNPDGGDDAAHTSRDGVDLVVHNEPAPKPDADLPASASCVSDWCHASLAAADYIHGAMGEGECSVCHLDDQGGHSFPLRRSLGETCSFCHAVAGNLTHQHAAITNDGCISCHEPHASDTKFLLKRTSIRELCLSCHEIAPGIHEHAPFAVGECTACHLAHESDAEHLLRGEGAEHCFICHAETQYVVENAPYAHAPIADGCTSCHSPHASDHELSLKLPLDETCFSCHVEKQSDVVGASASHDAVFTGRKCANCHDPHGSGRENLLRDRQSELCMQCHDREQMATDGRVIPNMKPLLADREFLHGPVETGQCSACHSVHGAQNERLLKLGFATGFYAPFDVTDYVLCFTCHAQELVMVDETESVTGFRDGDNNLHFVHVNQDRKGRTCKTCHDIHGSNLPRHLAESVPFEGSAWAMPIQFEMSEAGGSCTPGCHELRSYNRAKEPIEVEEAPQGDVR